ncbi:GNAT family N-acetyltransferase [Kineosporia sp. NBRC 101731]|uniref:GNAT family N-acetyltransferase n=1 Tax=Kineosporia sp. NBRC 101731 TaxID=3032199 RepID=UPI0024A004CE|nr:GNAT family N-acetyltransferase [Kineosporia sp. NBRC 101731]GLY33248.1 GNAT family N-acetyltransferase [Kineosporia sp. NBRC 101731]
MSVIEFVAPQDDVVADVTVLVNEVYEAGEKGIWTDSTSRTDEAEIRSFMRAGEIAVARRDGVVLGSVRVHQLPGGEGEFGMLAAHPAHRGTGLGKELVIFAENWARDRGLTTMQLELLFPTEWQHPVKAFLKAWYLRSGYELVRTGDFGADYPALAPRLATPCDYLIFHKQLAEGQRQ